MKKLFLIVLSSLFLLNPVFAVTADSKPIDISKYKTLGLKEALEVEKIELENPDYAEKDGQVPIYLFRGDGCHYCQGFLTFLSSISKEYGKYFKLVSFEVWSNTDNSALLQTISEFTGTNAGGVPYIIIGEEVFGGYASDYDEGIKSAIMNLYSSDDRYDVFEAYNQAIKDAKKALSGSSTTVIIWNFIFTLAAVLAVLGYTKKQNKALLEEIESLRKKEVKKEEKKENVKSKKRKKK